MNVLCSAKACPVILSSSCVFYEGENLIYSGINTNDNLQIALQKLDEAIGSDVFNISVVAPLQSTGGVTPILSITQSSATTNGYLSSTDWNTFNNMVPLTRTLTINGTAYDLTADRSWSVGTVTSVATSGPLTGGTITGSGTLGITQSGAASDGYLSSTDWNTFNNKLDTNIYTANGTLTGNRTVTMGSYTLSFEKDLLVNGLTVGLGNNNIATNTFFGKGSGSAITTGNSNLAIGYNTGLGITTGNANVLLGFYVGRLISTGTWNIAIGPSSAFNLTTGNSNTFIGKQAGIGITTGGNNILISSRVTGGSGIVNGSNNTIIGNEVGGLASTLSNNIILADGQGKQRIVINSLGETVIGSTAYPTFAALAKLHVLGAIQQDTVVSAMIKANSNGVLVNAVANTDYLPVNNPIATGQFQLLGPGITTYTPYTDTLGVFVADANTYKLLYVQNKNSGSDASADIVAYNDVSDVNSFFVDMGISSSNYSSVLYPIFTANSGYLYTGGGSTGLQPSNLIIGTSTANSDVILFAGGVAVADTVLTIKGNTKNILIGTGTITDTGEKVQVAGNVKVDGGDVRITGGGAYADSNMLGDPHQLTTKEYVDNQVAAGLHVHEPVRVESSFAYTATYTQGGTTPTITDITLSSVLKSVGHGLSVDDMIVFNVTSNGITAGLSYFVYQVLSPDTFTISGTIAGPAINTLINGSGLVITSRANAGVGATLVNAGAQVALVIDGVSVVATDRILIRDQVVGYWNGVYVVNDPGSPTTNWVLERATDANKFGTQSPNALGGGDYFFVEDGLIGIGESYVITNVGDFIIGTDTIVFTLFSASPAYFGTNPITVTGQNIQLTGIVDALHGGTGVGTVTTGDLLYGSATDVWSKLPLGVAYKSLIVNASGTNVEWNAIPLNQSAAVSGQLNVANGGTGASTLTGVLIGNGTSAVTAVTGTALQLLRRNSTNTAYEFFTPSYITLTSLSATSPLLYNNATGVFSIQVANASQDGYLSSTDWNTFNSKQAQINGTGFVKASGTTISYDNSTYYLASNPSAYIALTSLSGGTGISYNNLTGVITNSAPDQTVSLANGTAISVTGTYPNFTITNTAPDQVVTLSNGTGISVTGTYPGFTITNTAPDQVVTLTQGGTTTITGTYPNFTITSNDAFIGTVTSVSGTGTVSGLTLSGTVTSSGNLTLGGSLTLTSLQITTGLGYTPYNATNPSGFVNYNIYTSNGSLSTDRTVTGASKFIEFNGVNGVRVVSTGVTNEVMKLTGTEPYLQITAAGASNSASLFLSPSAGFNGTIQNRTGGGLEFYTGATPSLAITLGANLNLGIGGAPNNINSLEISRANKWSAAFIGNMGGARTPSVNYGIHLGWNYATSGESNILWGTGVGAFPYLTFSSWDGATKTDRMVLSDTGKLTLKQYLTATSFTGTAVGYIAFDNTGGLITVPVPGGGSLTGSGTATEVAFWSSSSSLTSSSNFYWDNVNGRLGINNASPAKSLDVVGTSLIADTRTYSSGTIESATFSKVLTVPNATSVSGSSTISAILAGGSTIFQGSATIPNSSTLANILCAGSLTFNGLGTITMTQATGIRAASSHQVLNYFGGTASSTVSHYAASSIYGFYNYNSGIITPIITNSYMLLINGMDDYGHTFTFTNRWGIYQAGALDNNFFAGQVLIGATATTGDWLNLPANTATSAIISATVSGAVLKTSAIVGDMEIDANGILYYTHNNLNRGVVDTEQFIMPTATYTLTSQTAAQKLFNLPTNGALSVKAATTYYFECLINVTSISNTSGSFGFAIGGTATLTSIQWNSVAIKTSAPTTAIAPNVTMNTTAANTALNIASAGTVGHAMIRGVIRINAAGTIIPQISLTVANAGIVQPNSYFKVIPIGTNAVTTVGNWS